jgi:hypothetical protein
MGIAAVCSFCLPPAASKGGRDMRKAKKKPPKGKRAQYRAYDRPMAPRRVIESRAKE